jgi:hypothetical protein
MIHGKKKNRPRCTEKTHPTCYWCYGEQLKTEMNQMRIGGMIVKSVKRKGAKKSIPEVHPKTIGKIKL